MYHPDDINGALDASQVEAQTTCADSVSCNIFDRDRVFEAPCADTIRAVDEVVLVGILCTKHMPDMRTLALCIGENSMPWKSRATTGIQITLHSFSRRVI